MNEKSVTFNAINSVVKYYKLPYTGHISTNGRLIGFFVVKN